MTDSIRSSASAAPTAQGRMDWAGDRLKWSLIWGLPLAALIGTNFLHGFSATLIVAIWISAFLVMGVACTANALRCGRVHCWFTGPWMLITALAIGLHHFDIVRIGSLSTSTVFQTGSAMTLVFWCLPEHVLGKYFPRR